MIRFFKILLIMSILIANIVISNELVAKSSFSGSRIRQACINYVHKILGDDAELLINKTIENQVFEESGIYAKCTGDHKILRGNCYIGFEFRKNGELIKRLEIPVIIKIYKNIPVAIRQLKNNAVISNNDFTQVKKDITYYSDKELLNPLELIGKKVKRNIKKGDIITTASLEREMLVHKGDKVLILAQSGAVRISSTGKALQDAAFGQAIRIKRDGSQGILQGSVAKDGSIYITTK